ncbi:MAG TPA: STAS/SEC14 domain-containing protein, partial [Sorangium sp.]|nr:STAS/SEC14 domain-containing protein [Sorangium sp.]
MLAISFDDQHRIFIIEPSGTLSKEDIQAISQQLNEYINQHDEVPGLLLHAAAFPGWKDFGTIFEHLHLVRDYEKLIPKIAVVSDSRALAMLPLLTDHFVTAQVRGFSEGRLEAA